MVDYHTKLILEAHRLIVKFISPSGKGFFRNILVSLHCSWEGLSIHMYLVGGWKLLYLTSYARQSHETDFRSISTHCGIHPILRQRIFRNVLVSLHCSWKGLSIEMYLVGGWKLLYLTSYGRLSHETDFWSTSTHCEIHLTLRQRIF